MALSCLVVPTCNLTNGVISSSLVASADDDTEYTSGDYKYTVSNKKATITGYTGNASKLTIPSKLGGYKVTEIGFGAFCLCTSLKKVVISDSVKTIDVCAFDGCSSLTSLTISDSVKSIKEYAFLRCTSLKSVTIPESVTKIGESAFGYKTVSFDEGPWTALKSFVLKGYSGTAAETYAKEYGVVFKDISTSKYVVPQVTNCYSAAASTSAIKISWNRIAGASGYRIYRYDTSKKKWKKIATVKNTATSYRDTGLKAGTTYKYKVKAYKKVNGKTYWGKASDTLKTSTDPAQVTMKSASKSKTAVRINWKKVTGASGYQVQRYNSSTKKWVTVKTIKSGSTVSYKNTGLKKGTAYKYRVRAYRTVNGTKLYGKWSSTKKVTTKS